MPRALRACPVPGCPNLTDGGRCAECGKASDRARGTRHVRGYGQEHTTRFRPGVLRRDPICQCDRPGQHDHGERCYRQSTRADHHPKDRRELVALGLDPNDPQYGRGLCAACDSSQTADRQPGGWHDR
jgi:5-methylcytosine-specific restriction enzyme A